MMQTMLSSITAQLGDQMQTRRLPKTGALEWGMNLYYAQGY